MTVDKSFIKINRVIDPAKSSFVARSLTVLDVDAKRVESRIDGAATIDLGDSSACVIDIECCIIDCSSCRDIPGEVVINPADFDEVGGFFFKVPAQAGTPEAPVYFLSKLEAKTAWKLSHESVKVPGRSLEARVLGIAAEVFKRDAMSKHGIAPTAPVIALVPKKAV